MMAIIMTRCRTCCLPDTKPDLHFKEGQCSACSAFNERPNIDWESRERELIELLDRFHGECIVPSSGGKDSTWQVLKLLELGAHVTAVTATTCHLTPIGRLNIDNLARYVTTIEVSPNKTVRAKLNRIGLELVGDISWPEHVAIFTTPFKIAATIGKSLMFYGENPQNQYGGPPGSQQAREMTRRWISEFGGFLGLRPQDIVGMDGITARDMSDYMPPKLATNFNIEAHFLGQYIPWDSQRNADVAIKAGMKTLGKPPSSGNWWVAENLDSALIGIHDYMMYLKYGYGRGCAQISVDVRRGLITREEALRWVNEHDGTFPCTGYAGVSLNDVLVRLGMTEKELHSIMAKYSGEQR